MDWELEVFGGSKGFLIVLLSALDVDNSSRVSS